MKWNTLVLSLKDLDLPMLNTLQVPRCKKTQVGKLFGSSNSYFRIVAYSPNTRKVIPLTDVCNFQDETILDLNDEQPTSIVQPTPLEVVVTENPQTTVIFNVDPISVHTDIPGSESESESESD